MGKGKQKRRRHRKAQQAARKKHRRKKSRAHTQGPHLAPTLHLLSHPFEGLSLEQRRLAIEGIARNSEKQYQEALSDLRAILRRHDPLFLLAHLTHYGRTAPVNEISGITKLDSDNEIFSFHVEMLQALSIQIEPDELSGELCGPDVQTRVWKQVKTLCDVHNFRQLNPAGADLPNGKKTETLAQWLMRGATQAVRNWGYHSQVKRIARELYCPFDAQLLEARGFSVSDVFDVFEKIVSGVESRQTAHRKTLSDLFISSGKDRRQLVEDYLVLIGLDEEKAEQSIEHINIENRPLNIVRSMLMAHYDCRLPDVFTFLTSDLAESLGLDEVSVNAILDEYALALGELSEYETEHLHLSNPVWKKPLIKLRPDHYFCALSMSFFSFVIPCMEAVLSPFATAVSNRRAEYLESKVAEIVKRRFPRSSVKRNFKWTEDGKTYETDLIAFIDSFALVIECKSGKVTAPALRGAPDRLRRHIQELLVDANRQSLRLKKRLEFLSSHPNEAEPIRDDIGYDLGRVRKVVRVSVCLEDFGWIQSSLTQLKDTDWLPADFTPCPTMNLADFETIFDLLEHPVQILHYLMKREVIEASVGYLADELDLLGLYLTTLLDIPDVEPDVEVMFTGMSSHLDSYYISLDAGVRLEKPRPAISPLFASIFSQLEQRGVDRWTEIGVALNMFSPDDQRRITKMLAKLERQVHRNWERQGHKNMVICVPSRSSSYALGYVMFKNGNAKDRQWFMQHAAATAMESNHVQTVVVIGRNIDQDDMAYHTIALFGAPADARE